MILIISLCSEKLSEEEFVKPLINIARTASKCIVKHYTKVTKKNLKNATHIILSGNPIQDNNYQNSNWSWIKETKKPILGICAGMHAIGIAHGAKISRNKKIGMRKIKIKKSQILDKGTYEVYELHNYGITLPKGFKTLSEKNKKILMIQKGNTYGLIFHPEVRMEKVIKNFVAKVI
ncbi:hypothetical protein HY483_02760 [Candidatus Woesearchaeota archaeon]|nr:hypothetical protein [Candidatus Woesearchaeota archaeon]